MLKHFLLVAGLLLSGCGPSGLPSTDTSSRLFHSRAEKIAFLEKYVVFRRTYQDLAYRIIYHNNSGGMVPGPSDWDIRVIAQVPLAELPLWTADLKASTVPDTAWLADTSEGIDCSGVVDWFQSGGVVVGVDRTKSIVVYRNVTK